MLCRFCWIYIYITIYIYLYIPGTCLSSILVVEQLNPPKQGLFQWKQGLGSRFIHITVDCRMFQQMVHVMSWSVSFMCLTQAQCCKTADGSLKVLIWAYLGASSVKLTNWHNQVFVFGFRLNLAWKVHQVLLVRPACFFCSNDLVVKFSWG